MNTGRIPTRPSLVHCKFVLIQFPSVLLAQVQPECQFSHISPTIAGEALERFQMNVGCISTHPSLVHCKFVLIQFPSFLLAQVQPECQFSHMYLSYHTGEAL